MKQNSIGASAFLIFILALIISIPSESAAHCDTMDGPVVSAARVAIEKSDLTPVLMWVREPHEKEIRAAFERTLAVRASGKEVREFADQYFFETLVRLHRQGEGEPYTGLKPAGSEIHPLIKAADKAIESGSVEKVVQHITSQISDSIRMLYSDALQKNHHAKESVQQGREYVESYVGFIHYVEKLDEMSKGPAVHGHGQSAGPPEHGH
ncbi:MAG: hypothetical protein CVU57_07945 [Deltaproteobacteria bacterium HGW-Deltaproteobacteria-15]|jgi:hypothetical protein|nr:MAG: hypothetical protein CVU57_07945 [Deltaproteobacteria bacterium HGW-Deltaproteobacteria-15]